MVDKHSSMDDLMRQLAKPVPDPDPEEKEETKILPVLTTPKEVAEDICKKLVSNDINPREAIMAFTTWLTTRPVPVTFSAMHHAAIACDLVKQFCDWNDWPECREDYVNYYKVPGEE